jgi:hypothetical protein
VIAPPEKLFVDTTLIHCDILDREKVLTAVYELDFFTFYKKFTIGGLITNRETRFAPRGANVRFVADDDPPVLFVRYVADPRVKIRQQRFAVERRAVQTRDAKGSVLTANTIEYVGSEKAADWDDELTGPPGRFIDN